MANKIVCRPVIDRGEVLMVYTGKQGCMCGCRGKYRYPKAMRTAGEKRRGYKVKDEEVNEGTVTRILNEISQCDAVEVLEVDSEVVYFVNNFGDSNRRIAVYLKSPADSVVVGP